jgi:hypothetical protein
MEEGLIVAENAGGGIYGVTFTASTLLYDKDGPPAVKNPHIKYLSLALFATNAFLSWVEFTYVPNISIIFSPDNPIGVNAVIVSTPPPEEAGPHANTFPVELIAANARDVLKIFVITSFCHEVRRAPELPF